MKNIKKVLAVVLAMAMVMAMSLTAFAEDAAYDTGKVTISGLTSGDTLYLYKVADAEVGADNVVNYTFASWVPEAYNSEAEISAVTGDDNIKAMANALAAAAKTGASAAYTVTENSDVSVEAGYYVANVEGTNAEVVYQNMLINAVMVANSSNSYDAAAVPATIKSSSVEVDKDVTGAADDTDLTDGYKVGDYVPFTVTTAIPNYPSNSTYATFDITDTPINLNIVNDEDHPVTVTVGGTAVEAGDTTFTLTANGTLTVSFKKDYVLANTGAAVVVTYSAQLTDAAAVTAAGTATNDAKVTYNPNPYVDTTNDIEDIVTVKTYGYVFDKVGKDEAALEGATFTLYSDAACETPVTKADGTTMISTSAIVGGKAYVYFNGLKAGTTYYVKETTVPAGYVACENFNFSLASGTATADNPATADVTETNYLVNENSVVNTPGAELPTTGGIGTTIFYIAGCMLVVGAGVILITHRRMDA